MILRAVGNVRVLALILLMGLLPACAAPARQSETEQGPSVPRIANLRFDPDVIGVGETTQISFYFEVGSADLQDGFLIERVISQFQLYHSLQSVPVDLRCYSGQVAGTVELPLRWSSQGVRLLELYVVTKRGNSSNRIRGTLTVR